MTNAVDPIDPPSAASVFCAYAREDEQFLNKLHVHLAMLRRQRKIDVWHDRRIEPGEDWEKEIDKQIETVDVILLLMSPDFLDSDYCFGKELQIALCRHQAGDARIIPIIVRPCEWKETELTGIQALPKDGAPISRWSDKDEAWLDVTAGIRRAVDSLSQERASKVEPTNVPPSAALTTQRSDQDPEQLQQRPDHVESMTRTSNTEAVIERLSGGSPLTKHVMREDMSRKACLVIARLGNVRSVNNIIGIEVDLRNDGEYPAYDVKVVRDIGNGFDPEPEEAAIDVILPRETRSAGFHVPPPKQDESNTWYPQQRTVRLKVTFRDGLPRRDEAIFTIKMHNRQSIWSPKEDKQAAQFSTYCAHLKPLPAPDRRPPGLTEDEHRILEALVRRAATKSSVFSPGILSRRVGDDKVEYQSDTVRGMESEIKDKDDRKPFYPTRDFLPSLVPTYLWTESRRTNDLYHMKRPLFEAYGFESPVS
jgi:hypothetical protein